MKVFWDTSTVLSLALKDSCHRDAQRALRNGEWRHVTSPLVALEAENRLHRLELERELGAEDRRKTLAWMEQLFASQSIVLQNVKDSRLMAAEGRRLIQHFSAIRPHGTIDLLHVACARLVRAEAFFTFDTNQAALAEAAGFRTMLF